MVIILAIFLLIFSFDFTKFRKQNQTMIEQMRELLSFSRKSRINNTYGGRLPNKEPGFNQL